MPGKAIMSNILFNASYFAIPNPATIIARWFNPYAYSSIVSVRGKPLTVVWTNRAHQELQLRDTALLVEMQLYFSCVIKKRVLFHDNTFNELSDVVKVNNELSVLFRPVEAASCDPIEFVKNYPERRELKSIAANNMSASQLKIDYDNEQWVGEFSV